MLPHQSNSRNKRFLQHVWQGCQEEIKLTNDGSEIDSENESKNEILEESEQMLEHGSDNSREFPKNDTDGDVCKKSVFNMVLQVTSKMQHFC